MRKLVFLIPFLLCFIEARSQTISLRGKIIEEGTNSPMTGATIYSKAHPGKGAAADAEGKFTLSLPAGNHTLVCSFIGFHTLETGVDIPYAGELLLVMKEDTQQMQEVVVTSNRFTERISNTQIGVERIEMAEMAKIPALFGERDIIKSIQLLPGIKSEGDGSSGFEVRGGTSAQNLITLDDATIYNAGHLMGIFSTFNDDALTNASLYKGQIPAQFGGGTSSVFDINTKNGNMKSYSVNGSIGLLAAKLSAEGPVVKDKVSFFVAARRSYLDLFLKLTEDYKKNTLNFYDINAKVHYNISPKDKLFVSFFSGRDNMGLDDLVQMKWGNQTANVRWFHQFNNSHYANTSFILSSYSTDNSVDVLDKEHMLNGYIRQVGVKQSFNLTPNEKHEFKYGFQTVYLGVKSAEWDFNTYREKEKRNAWENSIWVNEEWKVTEALGVSAGFRLNIFSVLGGSPYYRLDGDGEIMETLDYGKGEFVKTYITPEPRVSLNYRVTPHQSVKAGYSRTSQHIHAIRNGTMSLPFDRYTMSSNLIKPQVANQVSLGYVRLAKDEMYELSAEGYYKATRHVLDYKDGKSFSSEIEIERLILSGEGRAYGMELYAKKNLGRLTGWMSYTLSWSENKIPGINHGKWYTASNDRRHDVSIVGMYELNKGWNMAATWVFNTGQALTAPSAKYELNGETVYYFAERNGYRAPNYHRLDISATHTKQKKRYVREWTFGVYNLYNHYNPFIITFENDKNKPSGTKTVQRSLFGLIPSVFYNFKF